MVQVKNILGDDVYGLWHVSHRREQRPLVAPRWAYPEQQLRLIQLFPSVMQNNQGTTEVAV